MNTTLPAPRDLPPRSRTRIRAELQHAYGARPRARYVPLITGIAALAAVALVVVLVPWSSGGPGDTLPPAATTTGTAAPRPVFPGLAVQDRRDIEAGCARTGSQPSAELVNLVSDQTWRFALLYSDRAAMGCLLGRGAMPFNSGFAETDKRWLPGEFAVDTAGASPGGSIPGNKPEYRGAPGYEYAAGRISPNVARVTYTSAAGTVDAVLANGTYVAWILHPDTWSVPDQYQRGVVRAYDADGRPLGQFPPADYKLTCYVTPDGTPVGGIRPGTVDPATCKPAVRWR